MSWRNSDGFSHFHRLRKRNSRTARSVRPAVRQLHSPRFGGFFVGTGQTRTKDRTQCDEKCQQGSGHRRREFGEQYNSFPLSSFQIFERHSREPTPPTGSRTECPIFDVQFGYPSELSRVVRHQRHAKTAGMDRNEQVVRADHRAKSL